MTLSKEINKAKRSRLPQRLAHADLKDSTLKQGFKRSPFGKKESGR